MLLAFRCAILVLGGVANYFDKKLERFFQIAKDFDRHIQGKILYSFTYSKEGGIGV